MEYTDNNITSSRNAFLEQRTRQQNFRGNIIFYPLIGKLMDKNGSLYNTPPTYSIYIAGLVFKYVKKLGGISAVEEINERKANKLYDFLDQSAYFYAPVPKENRSTMNVVFRSHDDSRDKEILDEFEKQGFAGLKGYRDVGGFRASIYNAMPEEGIDALVSFLKEFERSKS